MQFEHMGSIGPYIYIYIYVHIKLRVILVAYMICINAQLQNYSEQSINMFLDSEKKSINHYILPVLKAIWREMS